MPAHTWDPDRYLTYADERGRPFVELLARVGADSPRTVVDLGCGPGNLTRLLAQRWPDAEVIGIDSSAEMLRGARTDVPGLSFELGDLRDWRPAAPVDVLVSNATLQWVPDHLALLPGLLDHVAPGGWFAMQVPGNLEEPSHAIRRDLAAEAPYVDHLAGVAAPDSHDPATYYDALAGPGVQVDVWETTYTHVLTGPDPVFTWVSATGARPTLEALPDGLREEFAATFRQRLAAAYPTRADGTVLLSFRRVFAVVQPSAELRGGSLDGPPGEAGGLHPRGRPDLPRDEDDATPVGTGLSGEPHTTARWAMRAGTPGYWWVM